MEQNGIRKNDIIFLMKKHGIDDIEKSLVRTFMDSHDMKTKNRLIIDFLKDADKSVAESITAYIQRKGIKIDLKNVERIFELLVDGRDRKLNGIFYTPSFIVDYIVSNSITKKTQNVCDPSCGSGAFLVEVVRRMHKLSKKPMLEVIENSIYGQDIIERNVKRCKVILSLLALENGEDAESISFNLSVGDSLKKSWNDKFDVVIGNPPYVRIQNLPANVRKDIQKRWFTAKSGNIDLFMPFIELGLNILKEDGTLGYIVPNTYFTSVSGKKLREYLQTHKYVREIVDFNHLQLFVDATTYTCITFFDRKARNSFRYRLVHEIDGWKKMKFENIKFSMLKPDSWNLLSEKDYENIRKIETAGMPLGSIANISIGIATLRNSLYIVDEREKEGSFYIKNYNGKKMQIERGITKKIIKVSTLKSEEDLKNNTERIIFPYRKYEGKYKLIPESELKERFPKTYEYLRCIRKELENRDRGKKKYEAWYAYGRRQGLSNGYSERLLSPDVSGNPRFIICRDDVLFYCGYSIGYSGDIELLSKILNSGVFWYYIKKTSRNYSSGYKSFAKHFISKFSVPRFTEEEKRLIKKSDASSVDEILRKKYDLKM